MFFDYNQIQGYPTPILYLKRGSHGVEDFANLSVTVLAPFTVLTSFDRATSEPTPPTAAARLVSMAISAGILSVVTETGNSSVALVSMVVPTPVTNSPNDTANTNAALVSMVHITAVSQTQSDVAVSGVILISMVV